MCCPSPHHRETDSLEGLRQVQDRSQSSFIFFLCSPIQSFHLHQNLHTVCWAPPCLPSVAYPFTRYFSCHSATSGALTASHQRTNVGTSAIGLSLVTFFGIKKNIVVHACCGHFPLCSTFFQELHCVSSSRFFCHIQGDVWAEAITTYSSFGLIQCRYFSNSPSFSLGRASSNFFNASFVQGFVLHVLHAIVALPMLCPFLPLCFTAVQQPGILFFYLQDLCTSPPCCRLTDLVQESSASLRNLNHFRHCLLMHFLHLFLLVLLISPPATCTISAGWIHAFSQSAANNSVKHHLFSASTLSFDLIFFVKSFTTFILCCCFISASSMLE